MDSTSLQTGANLVFLWLGFGIVVGMVANIFLPEGEPKGPFGILVVGVAGSCFGPLTVSLLLKPEHFNPISPVGFAAAVLAAVAPARERRARGQAALSSPAFANDCRATMEPVVGAIVYETNPFSGASP